MQKGSVKTLSIIDTLSELVQEGGQNATELAARPKVTPNSSTNYNQSIYTTAPELKARNAKVMVTSNNPRSPSRKPQQPTQIKIPSSSPITNKPILNSHDLLDVSAISSPINTRSRGVNEEDILSSNKFHSTNTRNSSGNLGARRKNPTHHSKSKNLPKATRGTSQAQTPDWIREIFDHAKCGLIDKLCISLENFEPTLIRNLTEHNGNNLLHTICASGHSNLLSWMTRRLGNELRGAILSDENCRGLTPPFLAIKTGQLNCIQWLVKNTLARDLLVSKENEKYGRSLLHYASKCGKEEIVNWLCEEMLRSDLMVDQLDAGGNSPLHLAARAGKTSILGILLRNGAKIDRKNNMGLKAFDLAHLASKTECAEFLILSQTSLNVSSRLIKSQSGYETLYSENNELKANFKELLAVSKKMTKERDEMNREMNRMYDSMMELHNNMTMELQVLKQENNSLKHVNHSKSIKNSTIEACTSLHERWQHNQKQWFSNNLNDSENKIWLAEENWRKFKNIHPEDQIDEIYSQRKLRDLMEESRIQLVKDVPISALPSTKSLDETTSDDEDDQPGTLTKKKNHNQDAEEMSLLRKKIAQRKKLATPTKMSHVASNGSLEESVYSTLSNDMYSKIGSPSNKDYTNDNGRKITHQNTSDFIQSSQTKSNNQQEKLQRKQDNKEFNEYIQDFKLDCEFGKIIELHIADSDEEEEFLQQTKHLGIDWGEHPSPEMLLKPSEIEESEEMSFVRKIQKKLAKTSPNKFNKAPEETDKNASSSFLNRITKWTKKSEHKDSDDSDTEVEADEEIEEHILPETFENFEKEFLLNNNLQSKTSEDNANQAIVRKHKSLSPSSRKSKFQNEATSLTTSEDSGIGIVGKKDSKPKNSTTITINNDLPNNNTATSINNLGRIDEASFSSRSSSTIAHDFVDFTNIDKSKNMFKPWYDIASDEEFDINYEENDDKIEGVSSLIRILERKKLSSDEDEYT